ncbi:MAG: tRNA preQ1(34) S-adenosylmethionine ribosyltransferase-isomerase QueA [Bdellovibrionales bacterium]|nr:tRNA preQ1(34) S-adenosylmethionine ribosyltransferase-isomerase QueA [Bdellovibrionales bacterium]
MKTSQFNFTYPESLVATKPSRPTRVMYSSFEGAPSELTKQELLSHIQPKDIVVINDTKVVKKRIFTDAGEEILFLDEKEPNIWTVLFPAKKYALGEALLLPGDVIATLVEKGLPQTLKINRSMGFSYFEQYGHMALPPYIQKARGERKSFKEDANWYQTSWAKNNGSSAAPTASLHFDNEDWKVLSEKGVSVASLTLHVGLGTFLPVHTEDLSDHKMHSEWVQISKGTLNQVARCKALGGRVWALGTTVTRALESWPRGYFKEDEDSLFGETDIFIQPGFEFQVVDVLMTNFHQPQSTLLALVAAFAGLEKTLSVYEWAIKKQFRLFSYGDLSVWIRQSK